MSDSDDTDVLLLIPPDFFIINSSDSDDSIIADSRGYYGGPECTVERLLVDELVNQVNELEGRISLIESKENLESSHFNQSFDCSVSVDSSNLRNLTQGDLALRFYSMSATGYRFGAGSSDNLGASRLQSTPVKAHRPQSLPASPAAPHIGAAVTRPGLPRHDLVQEPMASQDLAEPRPGAGRTGPRHHTWQDSKFMGEIDDFLESKKKSSTHYSSGQSAATAVGDHHLSRKRENVETIPKLNFGLKTFSRVPVNEAVVKPKAVTPLQMHSTLSNKVQSLKLPEVDKLLSDIEATQLEIGRKLQSKEAQIGRYGPSLKDQAILSRRVDNNFGSISDEGFGIREFLGSTPTIGEGQSSFAAVVRPSIASTNLYYNSQQADAKSDDNNVQPVPVHEPHIIVAKQNTELRNSTPSIPDRGFGLINWYKNSNRDVVGSQSSPANNLIEHRNSSNNREVINQNQASESTSSGSDRRYEFVNWPQNGQQKDSVDFQHNLVNVYTVSDSTSNKQAIISKPTTELNPSSRDYKQESACWSQSSQQLGSADLQSNEPHPPRKADVLQSSTEFSKVPVSEVNKRLFQPYVTLPGNQLALSNLESGFRNLWTDNTQYSQSAPPISQRTVDSDKIDVDHSHRSKKNESIQPHYKKRVEFVNQADALGLLSEEEANRAAGTYNKSESRGVVLNNCQSSSVGASSSSTNLLSLSELWGSESTLTTTVGTRSEYLPVERKLEEERYRRQHCEHLIQHLQSRLLEEQQRLAVAVHVDRGKDHAILQLQDAWDRLVSHWRELEEQRHVLANTLNAEEHTHKQQTLEMAQKLKRYEQELSKVLDLAQGYKDKGDAMEQENRQVEATLQEEQERLCRVSQEKDQLKLDKERLQEQLQNKQQEAQKEQKLLMQAKDEVNRTSASLSACEAELVALKDENGSLKLRLKEEHSKSNMLEEQKKSLRTLLEESKKKEKSLLDELKAKTDHVEKVKIELRDFYQDQVEEVVRDKLKEFQAQLDAAETSLQQEITQKEKSAAEAASKQVKNISDKHQLEVSLMEEKHKEELQLYQLHLMQATQQISQLQSRLQGYNTRKSEIVEKLHGVMETQWQEALRIIGDSPSVHSTAVKPGVKDPNCSFNTWPLAQFQTLGSSVLEMEKLKTVAVPEVKQGFNQLPPYNMSNSPPTSTLHVPSRDVKEGRQQKGEVIPPLPISHPNEGSSTADEMPFSKDGQLTYRLGTDTQLKKPSPEEADLKKYIQMLLNRTPGNPMSSKPSQEETLQFGAKWEKVNAEDMPYSMEHDQNPNDGTKTGQCSLRDGRSSKPPWK